MIIIGNVIYWLNVWKLKSNAMIYEYVLCWNIKLVSNYCLAKIRGTHAQNRKSNANWLLVSNTLGHANIVRFGNL